MEKETKQFNVVIVGVGGQGLITLLQILSTAAILEGFDVKTSELHGLSQRGGSVEVHIRFGKEVFSPLVPQGKADLILALEMQETLRASFYAGSQTAFLVNLHQITIPLQKNLSEIEVKENLKKVSKKIFFIPASQICQKEIGKEVVAGIFLISLAAFKNLLPLKPESILTTIKKIVPPKYFEINEKAFEISRNYDSRLWQDPGYNSHPVGPWI